MQHKIIKRAQVQLASVQAPRPGVSGAATPGTVRKRAALVQDEGRPLAIEVTCSCGEVTLIEIELDAEAPAKGDKPS